MLKSSQVFIRCLKSGNRPVNLARLKNFSSSTLAAEAKNVHSPTSEGEAAATTTTTGQKSRPPNKIVAAAFAALHESDTSTSIKTPFTDERIVKAQSVHELLSISEGNGVSRRHALKVVSVLAEWTTTGKASLTEFENDGRFVKLCRVLAKNTPKPKAPPVVHSEDISMILNVTADDEAAKLVASITLPQMVKIMTTLSNRKRRSTLLLRSLSYNITASNEHLDLKECADLLFSMATLNYIDENLFAKICDDMGPHLKIELKTSAVIGSIITSLGLLKFKNPEILDCLSDWVLRNHVTCRTQDIFSLITTLGALNYLPSNSDNLFEVLLPNLNQSEARKPIVWLDVVWSLILLNKATHQHVGSVLSENFINNVDKRCGTVSTKLKLLNIDGAAQYLMPEYGGARLSPTSSIHNVNMGKSKEKLDMIQAVIDSLKNLIQSEDNLKTNINTGLGFFIDAKCLLDKKCNPLPINITNEARTDVWKIAFIICDFHDFCRCKVEPTGVNVFASKLLKAQGYEVLLIPYTDFNSKDKLIHRVQYLENKLKDVVRST